MTEATPLASEQITQPKYLVWSNEHRAWWGADERGYTRKVERAGRYDRTRALQIAQTRGGGWPVDGNPYEIAVPEHDAIAQATGIDPIAALSASPAPSGQGVSGEAPEGMDSAPKDGTMIRLLVDYTDGGAPLEDEHPRSWTIGFNNLDNTGEDRWQFAGWSWTHDYFCEGRGTPVGWLPWSNPATGGDAK